MNRGRKLHNLKISALLTGGDVHINGQLIFGPSDFRKSTRILMSTIKAKAVNEVHSTVDGKPGAAIVVMLAPPQ